MISGMQFGIIYAGITCACFAVTLWKRYFRLAPLFTVFLGISAGMSILTLFVPNDDRWKNMFIWAPGEALLLLATVAALIEALSLRTSRMNRFPRFMLLFGILVSSFSVVMYFRVDFAGGGWYDEFLWERIWILLGLGVVGFCGFWFALLKEHGGHWAIRLHLAIFAVLMVAHVLLSSWWTHWTFSNVEYRVVAMSCYVAWAISAVRMDGELRRLAGCESRFLPVARPSELPIPVFRHSLPQGR